MNSAPDLSINLLPSERADLRVFEVVAKITQTDIEWMAEQVSAAFDAHKRIDMLIIMRNYEGAELGAIFDAEAFKAQLRSARHVRRYAVVGAPAWASTMINLFSPLTPVEEKTFAIEQEREARAWVDGGMVVSG